MLMHGFSHKADGQLDTPRPITRIPSITERDFFTINEDSIYDARHLGPTNGGANRRGCISSHDRMYLISGGFMRGTSARIVASAIVIRLIAKRSIAMSTIHSRPPSQPISRGIKKTFTRGQGPRNLLAIRGECQKEIAPGILCFTRTRRLRIVRRLQLDEIAGSLNVCAWTFYHFVYGKVEVKGNYWDLCSEQKEIGG